MAYRRRDGYGAMNVDGIIVQAHRVSYRASNGEIPKGLLVRHKCDNPPCVNPAHLLLGTYADNVRDMVERGRANYVREKTRGERNALAKLKDKDVPEIRHLRSLGLSKEKIALRYSVSRSTIHLLLKGRTWTHV